MIVISVIILIIGIVSICYAVRLKHEAQSIRVERSSKAQQYEKELSDLRQSIHDTQQQIREINQKQEQVYKDYKEKKRQADALITDYKSVIKQASGNYIESIEKSYAATEQKYQNQMKEIELAKTNSQEQLQKLRQSLSAGLAAQIREREKQQKLSFYKLSLSKAELEDVAALQKVKSILHDATPLNKVIWTTYFQKQTTELCNRVYGANTVCGIYKITNIKTQQCYIGQSIDVQTRIKTHIKCGLGIDAPAANKLYRAMQQDGVWNFTFQLLQACPRDQLDEKEKFWIGMYQANEFGYNSTKGNG